MFGHITLRHAVLVDRHRERQRRSLRIRLEVRKHEKDQRLRAPR